MVTIIISITIHISTGCTVHVRQSHMHMRILPVAETHTWRSWLWFCKCTCKWYYGKFITTINTFICHN